MTAIAPATIVRAEQDRTRESITGVLVGTAVGDALGLSMEGLSSRRQRRLFPGPLRHHLVGERGMISDDTEHALMVGQALLESAGDVAVFQRCLARKLRWWLASLPAGVGFATLRATLRLWMGVSPIRSGVMSAGNGPAMRSALLGVYFAGDPERRREFVRASTQITHRDPRAEIGAHAVAETATWMAGPCEDREPLLRTLKELSDLPEWMTLVMRLRTGLSSGEDVEGFAHRIGAMNGVSGYIFQTVPVAIYAALRHVDDFGTALSQTILLGGDTDTVGAITGALVGARVGCDGIPATWLNGIVEWPRSINLLRRIGERLSGQLKTASSLGSVGYCWQAIPVRNLLFLAIVLMHGFRRLLPPY